MEELQKEKTRLEERIKFHDDQHKEAARIANMYRRQLKTLERAMGTIPKTDAEAVQEVSNGLEKA